MHPLASIYSAYAILKIVEPIFIRFQESRSDRFAKNNSTSDELLGGERFFRAAQLANQRYTKNYSEIAFEIDKDGNDLHFSLKAIAVGQSPFVNATHPSFSSRIASIGKNTEISNVDNDPRTLQLEKVLYAKFTHRIYGCKSIGEALYIIEVELLNRVAARESLGNVKNRFKDCSWTTRTIQLRSEKAARPPSK
jgi:hypothetical protein